jgi:hypothetical protein
MTQENVNKKLRGSAHVGPHSTFGYHGPWPLAGLQVSKNEIRFSFWPVRYQFNRDSIVGLCIQTIFGLRYLRIVHSNPRYEKWVLFKPLRMYNVIHILESAGYQLQDPSAIVEPAGLKFGGMVKIVSWVSAIIVIAVIAAAFYGATR